MKKVLFLTNRRSLPYTQKIETTNKNVLSSGLSNSIGFVVEMLKKHNVDAEYRQLQDASGIDREIHHFRPDIAIIEAIWVTPTKLKELAKLHPKVKWVIRIHSEIPFLSNEGNAIEWLTEYSKIHNVFISTNSKRATKELLSFIDYKVFYLPNYYPVKEMAHRKLKIENEIHISCFGAIRPMKNQLLQAISAIKFAEDIHKELHFHINIHREETGGNNVLKNIKALFKDKKHKLVEHPWANHENFIKTFAKIHIGMQVSLSETYNIVTADMVTNFIPVVVSKEIKWVSDECKADANSYDDIVGKLHHTYKHIHDKEILKKNIHLLRENSEASVKEWAKFIEGI